MDQQQAVANTLSYVDEMLREPTRYHLVLVVGADEKKLSGVLSEAAAQREYPVLDMGMKLSETLVAVPEARRALKAGGAVRDLVKQVAGASTVLAVDNIDILFDPALSLSPLDLLTDISRSLTLIVAWPGQCTWGEGFMLKSLSHADPSHDEYRSYPHADTTAIVDLERTEAR
jgi:hypothetical protein